jgi:anti-anti-sigma regulatory factor
MHDTNEIRRCTSKRNQLEGLLPIAATAPPQPSMDIQILQRQTEGICILDLQGRLVMGESEGMLRDAIAALARSGAANIILNFAETKDLDDDGLSALVLCNARLRKSGGALKLLNVGGTRMGLALKLRLDTDFDVFVNEHDSVNSFFPNRAVLPFDILEFVNEQQTLPSTVARK